jgi:hypothetical protein
MAGSWVVTVSARLPDGTSLTREVEVPLVRAE